VKADKRVVDQAGIIPLVYDRDLFLTSARVHDYQHQPLYGPLLDQLWVQ